MTFALQILIVEWAPVFLTESIRTIVCVTLVTRASYALRKLMNAVQIPAYMAIVLNLSDLTSVPVNMAMMVPNVTCRRTPHVRGEQLKKHSVLRSRLCL